MARFPKPWYRRARKAWFVTLDGVQQDLGPDKREAFERFYQLMRQPQPRQVSTQLVVAIVDAYLDWVQRHRSPATFEWYRYRLQQFVDRYPELAISQLRPFHVQKWVDSLGDLKPNTQRNCIRAVKRALRWATQQGYIDSDPLVGLSMPGAERKEVCITAEEYSRLLEFTPEGPFRDLVVTTWETGCRPQESLRVEARHVDLARQRWVFPQSESKMRRAPRVVYLSEAAVEITARLAAEHPVGPLFRNGNGRPWSTNAVKGTFDRIRVRMGKTLLREGGAGPTDEDVAAFIPTLQPTRTVQGVEVRKSAADLRCEAKRKLTKKQAAELAPRYSLYALRHSWATRALQSGLDGLTVAILMGHSDPSTLARVYQHLSHDPGHLLKQAQRVNG